MEKVKQRSPYWDNIKGFLIILVVFAHFLYQFQGNFSTVNAVVDVIYMFHMPAFIFVSGYFGKSENSRSAASIIRLAILYLIFNSLAGILFGFGVVLNPLYSYWYLLSLIVWRLTAHHLAKIRGITLILFAAAVLVGFYTVINNDFAIARIIAFYPYYMLGFKLSSEKSEKILQEEYSKRLLKGAGAAAGAAVIAVLAYIFMDYTDEALLMCPYVQFFDMVGRLALIAVSLLVIFASINIFTDKKIPLLSMFGQNSLWIFLFHRPFTLWITGMIKEQNLGVVMITSVIGTFALCLIFGNDRLANVLNKLQIKRKENNE